MLRGPEIKRQIELGNIVIDPFHEEQLNPNSYNLRLSDDLLTYAEVTAGGHVWSDPLGPRVLDMAHDNPVKRFKIPPQGIVLYPGILYLGSTIEWAETKQFVPAIEGRSSVARLGLQVHLTAGFGDEWFRGTWCLELAVVQPLRVYAGVAVCQISFTPGVGEPMPYAGKYQDQCGPQPSQLWRELAGRSRHFRVDGPQSGAPS